MGTVGDEYVRHTDVQQCMPWLISSILSAEISIKKRGAVINNHIVISKLAYCSYGGI